MSDSSSPPLQEVHRLYICYPPSRREYIIAAIVLIVATTASNLIVIDVTRTQITNTHQKQVSSAHHLQGTINAKEIMFIESLLQLLLPLLNTPMTPTYTL